jgi:hypothetical protein
MASLIITHREGKRRCTNRQLRISSTMKAPSSPDRQSIFSLTRPLIQASPASTPFGFYRYCPINSHLYYLHRLSTVAALHKELSPNFTSAFWLPTWHKYFSTLDSLLLPSSPHLQLLFNNPLQPQTRCLVNKYTSTANRRWTRE